MEGLAIETSGLTRRFGSAAAVEDVSLRVPTGSVYGFLGLNGAGKTTTIRLLLGLLRPTRGIVTLLGRSMPTHRIENLRDIGSLIETPSVYPHLTGRENLEAVRRILGAPAAATSRALVTVGLGGAESKLVREYSLGMKQRLGLAQCLLGDPRLLVLDEPTNGLDPGGIQEVRDLVRRLPAERGTTVFLSSHILSEVEQVATHIGVIHRGRIRFQGTVASVLDPLETLLELRVDAPADVLLDLSSLGWHARREGDGRLVVRVRNRGEAARINAALVQRGRQVFHLAEVPRSLERSFFSLIGESGGEVEP